MRDQPTPDQPVGSNGSDDRSGSDPEDTGTAPAWSQVPRSDPDGHPRDSEPADTPDGADLDSDEWDADEDAAADDEVPAVNPGVRRIVVHPAETPRRRIAPWERRRAPVPSGTAVTVTAAPATQGDIGAEPAGPDAPRSLRLADLRGDLLRGPRDRFVARLAHAYWSVVAMGPRVLVHPVTVVLYALVAGAMLRLYDLTATPPGFNQDEAVAGYDAWSLWHTLRDHHGHPLPITGFLSFGDWASPFLPFWLIPFMGLLGPDLFTVRLGSVTLGLIAIVATYLLAQQLTGRRGTAAAAACFMAISPWAIHLSRFAIPPATVPALTPLALWLTLRALRVRTTGSLILAGIALGCCVAGYPTMKLYIPLAGMLIVVLYARETVLLPIRGIILAAAAFLAIAGPNLIFTIRDPDGANRQRFISIFNRDDFSPGLLFEQYWSYIRPGYLFGERPASDAADAASRYTTELAWTIPFLVVGAIALVIRAADVRLPWGHRRPAILLGSLIVLAPVPGVFTTLQNGSREVELTVLFAILAGIGLVALTDLLRRITEPLGILFARVAIVAILVVSILPLGIEARGQFRGYFLEYPRDWGVQRFFHTGFMDAAQYAYEVQDDYDVIWFVDTNQGYMLFLLTNRVDPSLVHDDLENPRQDFGEYLVDGLGKFRFNGVYVGLPDDIEVRDERVVFESFPYPDGRGYVATAGETADGQRILVVSSVVR